MEGTSVGLGDAMLLANQGKDQWGGGCFFWVIILFWLMAGGGWGNNRNCASERDVYASAQNTQLFNDIGQVRQGTINLGNGIADAAFALNSAMQTGFTGVMRDNFGLQQVVMGGMNNLGQAIAENRFTQQNCCCETNKAIMQTQYENAMNTAAINSNATANTQKILDRLCAMEANAKDAEIAQLRQQLSNANLMVSQQAQNAQLIGALRPFPNPAYIVASPYAATNCNCGVGVGV